MFLWNGGPGSNSTLLHLTGFGPKRLKALRMRPRGQRRTWLRSERTSCSSIPIGTGFSRPARGGVRRRVLQHARRHRVDRRVHPCVPDAVRRVGCAALPRGRELRLVASRRRGGGARAARYPRRGRAADLRRRADRPGHGSRSCARRCSFRRGPRPRFTTGGSRPICKPTCGPRCGWPKRGRVTRYAPALKRLATLSDQERDAIVAQLVAVHGSRSQPDRSAVAGRGRGSNSRNSCCATGNRYSRGSTRGRSPVRRQRGAGATRPSIGICDPT